MTLLSITFILDVDEKYNNNMLITYAQSSALKAVLLWPNYKILHFTVCSYIVCLCTGISGYQYTGVSSGQHTVRVKATATADGQIALSNTATVDLEVIAIDIFGISGKQKIYKTI